MSKIEVNLNKFKSSVRVGKSRIKSGHEDLNIEVYRSLVKVIPTIFFHRSEDSPFTCDLAYH